MARSIKKGPFIDGHLEGPGIHIGPDHLVRAALNGSATGDHVLHIERFRELIEFAAARVAEKGGHRQGG